MPFCALCDKLRHLVNGKEIYHGASVPSLGLVSPRAATDGFLRVTLFFLEKNLTTFLVITSESDDLFSCRLFTTPTFPHGLSSVLSKN